MAAGSITAIDGGRINLDTVPVVRAHLAEKPWIRYLRRGDLVRVIGTRTGSGDGFLTIQAENLYFEQKATGGIRWRVQDATIDELVRGSSTIATISYWQGKIRVQQDCHVHADIAPVVTRLANRILHIWGSVESDRYIITHVKEADR